MAAKEPFRGYMYLHTWIRKQLGTPNHCVECGKDKKCTWANISGEYKRDFSDWKRLCHSCHNNFDHNRLFGNACRRGHERNEKNTYINPNSGWHLCRVCKGITRREQTRVRIAEREKLS